MRFSQRLLFKPQSYHQAWDGVMNKGDVWCKLIHIWFDAQSRQLSFNRNRRAS
jgi:hypothetical protein